ncbi:MAG TPA: choice-of-anchor Q domain-containing protein, partial [Bacteroidales bacterium]|nr:choice-of-anchor Q domain-containing protein [Bacteroidales bacterium]
MKTVTFLFLFIASLTINAQIIHVPGDYPTVQQGINAALAGDTVIVAEGIYYEQISFLGKPITVASNYILDANPVHVTNTILDGCLLPNDSSSVVLYTSGEDTTSILNGFTIRNGKGTLATDSLLIYAGGILVRNSGAKIINNHITHNIIDATQPNRNAFGAAISTPWESTEEWIVILNNTIDSNKCISGSLDALGAAIISCYNTRMMNNIIINNSSISGGSSGHAYANVLGKSLLTPPDNWFIAENNIIKNNLASCSSNIVRGSGLLCAYTHSRITGNDISNNEIETTYQGTYFGGAGIYIEYPLTTIIRGNTVNNNISSGYGGGLNVLESSSSGMMIIENNTYLSNSSEMGGGAIHFIGNTDNEIPVIQSNKFISNQSIKGGAISGQTSGFLFQNNTFHLNEASNSHGGAIYLLKSGNSGNCIMINNGFSENSASQSGGAIYSFGYNLELLNNILWQDNASMGAEISIDPGILSMAYNNIDISKVEGNALIMDGNIFEDPQFCDTVCLKPESDSPCLDHGTDLYVFSDTLTAPLYDILGQPRPLNNGFDMGAYEVLIVGTHNHKT